MLPRIHAISLSAFRAGLAEALRFVVREGGNLWLTHRGRPVAVLMPMQDAEQLAALQGRSLTELLHRVTLNRDRILAARTMAEAPLIAAAGWELHDRQLDGNPTWTIGIDPGTEMEHPGDDDDIRSQERTDRQRRKGP